MPDSIYLLEDVVKRYDSREILNIPRFGVERGEILALVGPSGAGKSTLLRLLNFLESPTAGHIRFAGYATNGNAPLDIRRQVTTVFQRPVLLNTSVFENVAYGLRLRGQGRDRDRIQEALARVGLAELSRQRARTLSGGEAQRVALARAIVIEPAVLLLDEPTANLDPYNIGLIEEITRKLNRDRGTTVVLVTHNVFQAKRLAHRVALMLGGAIVETAPPDRFFTDPHDPRAAAFVRGDLVY